jgi:hypothetical protein
MEYVEPFLLGGSIIAGSKWVSKMVDPAYAAMVAGMPTGIIASFFLANDSDKRQFYKGYGISDAIVAIAVNVIALIAARWTDVPVNVFSVAGYFIWLTLSYTGIKTFAAKKNYSTGTKVIPG